MGVLAAGDFTYTVNPNGVSVTITGYAPVPAGTYALEIPAVIEGKAVTAIGDSAFKQNYTGMTGVTIPASVVSIGNFAFYSCSGLTSVTIPTGIINIADYAFYNCAGLTSVTIPPNVTTIGAGAFSTCTGLTSVVIPPSVTTIQGQAFFNCTGLTSMNIPSSVTTLGSAAFYRCTSLSSVVIPSGVTTITNGLFDGCSGLTSITIPAGVTGINNKAFFSCTGLTNITIPAAVTSIGTEVFAKCTSLISIAVSADNSSFSSLNGVLFNKLQTLLVACPPGLSGSYEVPVSVTSIGTKAFSTCDKLTAVTFPANLESIGELAFFSCKLTSVTFPPALASIGQEAFSDCDLLTQATFMGNAPIMGFSVFGNTAAGFTVFYYLGAEGFSEPEWSGYPSAQVGVSDPVSDWLLSKGLPANSNLLSDSNGDGVNLLMAYALNLNPNQNLSGSMPQPVFMAGQMSLNFYAGTAGITYTVEASTDMQAWTTAGVTVSGPGINRTATVAMTGPGRFMRLVVSQ